MKKRLLTILFLMTALFCYGQEESGHLLFKGIPIDGTMKEFVSKLKSKGFKVSEFQKEKSFLKGNFAGFKDCDIIVQTAAGKDLVNTVIVIINHYKTWIPLESEYLKLKNLLTIKYGAPEKVVEIFPKYDNFDITPNADQKMLELLRDNCTYSTEFITEKGVILLSICSMDRTTGFVGILYKDQINSDIENFEALDDL